MASRSNSRPPWNKESPAKSHKELSATQKRAARTRARAAGRKYPNFVDNMAVARKKKSTKSKNVRPRGKRA